VTFGGAAVVCTNPGGQVQTLVTGSASCVVAAGQLLAANSPISVTAVYSGVVFNGGSSPVTGAYNASPTTTFMQTVGQDSTTTNLIISPTKPIVGGSVSFTAIVIAPPPGSGQITGEVSFLVLGKHTGPINCSGLTNNFTTLATNNEATCTLNNLSGLATPLKVTISYYGDSNYLPSVTKTKSIRLH